MPNFLKATIATVVYLAFAAIEIVVLFGGFLVAFGAPYLVAKGMGATSGDNTSMTALTVGLILFLLWYLILDHGGRKRIELWFRDATHKAIKSLGAGSAIED